MFLATLVLCVLPSAAITSATTIASATTSGGNGSAQLSWTGGSASFAYTGAVQSLVVPAGVSTIDATLVGRSGGDAAGIPGGIGGTQTGTIKVTPGTTLYVYVGRRGHDGESAPCNVITGTNADFAESPGGFNGGAAGGLAPFGAMSGGGDGWPALVALAALVTGVALWLLSRRRVSDARRRTASSGSRT